MNRRACALHSIAFFHSLAVEKLRQSVSDHAPHVAISARKSSSPVRTALLCRYDKGRLLPPHYAPHLWHERIPPVLRRYRSTTVAVLIVAFFAIAATSYSAELVELSQENWQTYVPEGKEVDAIFGDFALRSDRLMAVVAKAVAGRDANMTVRDVGGSLIDFTRRDVQNDQLSCFYPHAMAYKLEGPVDWPADFTPVDAPATGEAARLAFTATPLKDTPANAAKELKLTVGYELADGNDYLSIRTLISNPTDHPIDIELTDGIRADGEFRFGNEPALQLAWCYDSFWKQAYGLQPGSPDFTVREDEAERRRPARMHYRPASGADAVTIAPGQRFVFERRIFPAADTLGIQAIARRLRGEKLVAKTISIKDATGPVTDAVVRIDRGAESEKDPPLGAGRTNDDGKLVVELPPGQYSARVLAQGRKGKTLELSAKDSTESRELKWTLPAAAIVEGHITDAADQPSPCKVAFRGLNVDDPNFGPDSAINGVRNLWYTPDGRFRVELLPGRYEVLISHGPEFDAVTREIEVKAGEVTRLSEQLRRSVDTTGWLSAEMHSHSSPSGDNTSSQRGRVLNLLAEHLEFIPCTEHQRISTYQPHLEFFNATGRVLTCTGMELTGAPLPIDHQNAFPLVMHTHEQNGGGPRPDVDPEVQIERLAMWDNAADKVVQINHPNIAQMIGDRDLDGKPDQGFRKMFYFADTIEIHPPAAIFDEPVLDKDTRRERGNRMIYWMQLFNFGYRIPGVVNTDAHYNFHGSGSVRTYIRSATDDPSQAKLMDICHSLHHGQAVVTNGPFMTVAARSGQASAGPGQDLVAVANKVQLKVQVQCANWLDVNRVQVFINGRPDKNLNFTRHANPAMFAGGVMKFDHTIDVPLHEDAHIIVATANQGGQLGRIMGPHAETMPVAISNPIFVDVDGGGFTPNRDDLDQPLPIEPNHKPNHDHQHLTPQRQHAHEAPTASAAE